LSKSDRLVSISGLSAFNTRSKHWLCNEDLVTVKLTNITLEQISGENSTVGSRVDKNMTNFGDKSISWSPSVIKTRPPVRRSSRFNTGFKIGS